MDCFQDPRLVLTLDAGGTNLVFGAMRGGKAAIEPITLATVNDDRERCLQLLVEGFQAVRDRLAEAPVAISFAFPGPADYPAGILGDLPNFPAFRGGVALGPMLEARFGLPVFINNDGDLFAYGEAMAGLLPEVNAALEAAGSPKRFRHLLGVTLGTGFGGGLVLDGQLHLGDNAAGAEIWCLRNRRDPVSIAEEGASIRAVRRAYADAAGLPFASAPEPKVIGRIAQGEAEGNREAAQAAFQRLGEVVGDSLATAVSLVDALVVVGGGLSGAHRLFMPALLQEMNGTLQCGQARCPRMEVTAFDLEDPASRATFLRGQATWIDVPGTDRKVAYDPMKRTGIGVTRLGTSHATALGAYAFALSRLGR